MYNVTTDVPSFQKILRDAKGSGFEDDLFGGIKVELDNLDLYIRTFRSPNRDVLVFEDRGVTENNLFDYYVLLPNRSFQAPFDHVAIVLHGLNEQRFDKIFPWAYNLVLNGTPTILFPMAFHISRRPNSWISKTSFNWKISERFIHSPERFFCGGLQTYFDIVRLVETIVSKPSPDGIGEHGFYRSLFTENPRIHFLGYSAGGYVTLALNAINPKQLFTQSKSLIFCSGAPLHYLDPATIYIINKEAAEKTRNFYSSYPSSTIRTYFQTWFEQSEEGRWFRNIFLNFDNIMLHERLEQLAGRMLAVVNVNDKVIPLEGIRNNLKQLHIIEMSLGIHEFPFNRIGYEDNHRKALVQVLRNVNSVAREYVPSFRTFVSVATSFFQSEPGDFRFLTEANFVRAGDRIWQVSGCPSC